jgi:hypothetical protein
MPTKDDADVLLRDACFQAVIPRRPGNGGSGRNKSADMKKGTRFSSWGCRRIRSSRLPPGA